MVSMSTLPNPSNLVGQRLSFLPREGAEAELGTHFQQLHPYLLANDLTLSQLFFW